MSKVTSQVRQKVLQQSMKGCINAFLRKLGKKGKWPGSRNEWGQDRYMGEWINVVPMLSIEVLPMTKPLYMRIVDYSFGDQDITLKILH